MCISFDQIKIRDSKKIKNVFRKWYKAFVYQRTTYYNTISISFWSIDLFLRSFVRPFVHSFIRSSDFSSFIQFSQVLFSSSFFSTGDEPVCNRKFIKWHFLRLNASITTLYKFGRLERELAIISIVVDYKIKFKRNDVSTIILNTLE